VHLPVEGEPLRVAADLGAGQTTVLVDVRAQVVGQRAEVQ